jgi:hypothetical protein
MIAFASRVPVLLGVWVAAIAMVAALALLPTADRDDERLLLANDTMETALLRQAVLVEGDTSPDVAR